METGEVDPQPTTPSAKKTQLRPKWSNGLEGKLALMASMVTPFEDFAMASNMYFMGGGLIFIPLYLFFLALIGVPMLLLEVGVGQFSGRGTWCAWNIAPLFKGIGYLVTIINAHAAITTFWHLMAQFVFCYDLASLGPEKASVFAHCENLTESALEGVYGDIYMNVTYDEYGMVSTPRCEAKTIFARRWESWYGYSYDSTDVSHGDAPQPAQIVAMFLAIFSVCGVVAGGRRVIGLLSAVCVLAPLPLRFMLLIRAMTLSGSVQGLMYGFFPDPERLLQANTYVYISLNALYTVGAASGKTLTAASYNRFNNCFVIDCLLAVAYKVFNIVIIGLTVSGIIGALAHAVGRSFSDVNTGGLDVVAMVTETLLLYTPGGGFWTACYLICILLSCYSMALWTVETTVMAIWDLLPHTPRFRQLLRKPVLVSVFALPWLAYSIGYCNKNSWRSMAEAEQVTYSQQSMIVVCILECVAIAAVFGARRFQACWSSMQGRFCGCPYPLLFWGIITPIGLTILFILSLFSIYSLLSIVGAVAAALYFLFVVISAVFLLFTRPGTMRQKWRIMTTPWDLAPHQMQPTYGRYETYAMSGVAN